MRRGVVSKITKKCNLSINAPAWGAMILRFNYFSINAPAWDARADIKNLLVSCIYKAIPVKLRIL